MKDSRETSMQILEDLLKNKNALSFSSALKNQTIDSAFITMLTLTALRHLVYIRNILKTLINKKLSAQHIVGQCALILGATELLYMQTPPYAVINTYVSLVKNKTNHYIAGFVNAVLRQINNTKENFIAADKGDFFPQSFRSLLKNDYSSKTIKDIEKTSILEPLLDISCISPDSAQKLTGDVLPLGTIRLKDKGKISNLPDYQKGTWWVQDFSAALAVKMLDDIKGKKVLELCAAPGGKTAQLLSAGAKLTCLDISQDRLKILSENLNRLQLFPEKIICADALDFLSDSSELYDIILLDAPCSATGTLRRHPEIVHTKTASDIAKQTALQQQLLQKADSHLKSNGILLYCTCSLFKAEGEKQIENFLKNFSTYKTINLKPKIPSDLSQIATPQGWLRILPFHLKNYGGADGFFIACLKKG